MSRLEERRGRTDAARAAFARWISAPAGRIGLAAECRPQAWSLRRGTNALRQGVPGVFCPTARHGSTGGTIRSPLISRLCIRGEPTAIERPSCSMGPRGVIRTIQAASTTGCATSWKKSMSGSNGASARRPSRTFCWRLASSWPVFPHHSTGVSPGFAARAELRCRKRAIHSTSHIRCYEPDDHRSCHTARGSSRLVRRGDDGVTDDPG